MLKSLPLYFKMSATKTAVATTGAALTGLSTQAAIKTKPSSDLGTSTHPPPTGPTFLGEDGAWLDGESNTTWPHAFPSELATAPLFAHQARLPRLPVPTLQATLHRFMASNVPLLSASEYKTMMDKIRVFLDDAASDAAGTVSGRALQMRLLRRAEQKPSWLLELWNELAYLTDRSPLPFFVSYFFGFDTAKLHSTLNTSTLDKNVQTMVASKLVCGVLQWYRSFYGGDVLPDTVNGQPLCSHMYRYLFHACRIPQKSADTTIIYEPKGHGHIAVLANGHVYTVQVLDAVGSAISASKLQALLEDILRVSQDAAPLPIGLLSAMDRNSWSHARARLLPDNSDALQKLESAILVLCLDNAKPDLLEEQARTFWHGDAVNRFYDKSLQFIVTSNGHAGLLAEHSMMDGMITHRLCDDVLNKYPKSLIIVSYLSFVIDLPRYQCPRVPLTAKSNIFLSTSRMHYWLSSARPVENLMHCVMDMTLSFSHIQPMAKNLSSSMDSVRTRTSSLLFSWPIIP